MPAVLNRASASASGRTPTTQAQKAPDTAAGGVFFAALEDNGHVYAYVLNKDETVVQIADIDGTIACESV